jgi:hypothetical protein
MTYDPAVGGRPARTDQSGPALGLAVIAAIGVGTISAKAATVGTVTISGKTAALGVAYNVWMARAMKSKFHSHLSQNRRFHH